MMTEFPSTVSLTLHVICQLFFGAVSPYPSPNSIHGDLFERESFTQNISIQENSDCSKIEPGFSLTSFHSTLKLIIPHQGYSGASLLFFQDYILLSSSNR